MYHPPTQAGAARGLCGLYHLELLLRHLRPLVLNFTCFCFNCFFITPESVLRSSLPRLLLLASPLFPLVERGKGTSAEGRFICTMGAKREDGYKRYMRVYKTRIDISGKSEKSRLRHRPRRGPIPLSPASPSSGAFFRKCIQ